MEINLLTYKLTETCRGSLVELSICPDFMKCLYDTDGKMHYGQMEINDK